MPTPATISGAISVAVAHPRVGDQGDPAEADRLQQRPDDEERALAEAVDQLARDRGDEEERRRPGQQPQAGAERAVAEPRLEELGHEEDGAEEAADGAEDRRVAGREGARAEEAHRQHRRPRAQLDRDEGAEQDDRGGEGAEHLGAAPAGVVAAHQSPDEAEDAAADQRQPGQVERASRGRGSPGSGAAPAGSAPARSARSARRSTARRSPG